jgi:hypothetical protein
MKALADVPLRPIGRAARHLATVACSTLVNGLRGSAAAT